MKTLTSFSIVLLLGISCALGAQTNRNESTPVTPQLVTPQPSVPAARAGDRTISDVVGYLPLTVPSGSSLISTPFQRDYTYRGLITLVTSNAVTFANVSDFGTNKFEPRDGFDQYVLVVKRDADKAESDTNNVTGDWWAVAANTSNTVMVTMGGDNLSNYLAAGDTVEVRHLVSLKDLFGSDSFLNQGSNSVAPQAGQDVLRYLVGDGFGRAVTYRAGAAGQSGYFVDGAGPYDGSTLTLYPDEPLALDRRAGAPAANLVLRGHVQTTRLTHYLSPPREAFGLVYPAASAITNSGLREAILAASAAGTNPNSAQDKINELAGFTMLKQIHLRANGDFYVENILTNGYQFLPGANWMYEVKPNTGTRVWRQYLPYSIPPTNDVPELQLLTPVLSGRNVILTLANFESKASYSVYWRTNLASGSNWACLTNGAVGQASFTNAQPGTNAAFFIAFSSRDTDGDGLSDGIEVVVTGTSPTNADTDGDGLPDAWEFAHFGHFNQIAHDDPDGDGWTNLQEYRNGSNPNARDNPRLVRITSPRPSAN